MPGKYKHDTDIRKRNDLRISNERELCVKLEKWRDLDKTNMLLVHSIDPQYFKTTEFMQSKAENVFRKWDVISASLITSGVMYGGNNGRDKYTGMYGEVGFVLEAPPQNILGTHHHDVYFPTHIGTKMHGKCIDPWVSSKNSWKLADAIFSGKGKGVAFTPTIIMGKGAWPCNENKSYNVIEAPTDILFKSNRSGHNEILIIGKPGVSLYHDYPPSKEIKVKALIVGERYHDDWVKNPGFTDIQGRHDLNIAIERLMEINDGLDVITI